jgi:hypothetical protein
LRLLPYTKCSVLCLVYTVRINSLLQKLLRLANRLFFPAPSLGCRQFPILLKCAECTAFRSILRRSSSIITSLTLLTTLLRISLFSLLTLSFPLNLKEFVHYICHNGGAEFLYIFHTRLEMCQLFVSTLTAKNIVMVKERPTKCIFKVNHIFRTSGLLLHVSALQERHIQRAQRILMKLCVCYVISAE